MEYARSSPVDAESTALARGVRPQADQPTLLIPTRRFRLGIICRDAGIDPVTADCILRMLRVPGVELSLVIQDRRRPAAADAVRPELTDRSPGSLLWRCYTRLFPLSAAPLE